MSLCRNIKRYPEITRSRCNIPAVMGPQGPTSSSGNYPKLLVKKLHRQKIRQVLRVRSDRGHRLWSTICGHEGTNSSTDWTWLWARVEKSHSDAHMLTSGFFMRASGTFKTDKEWSPLRGSWRTPSCLSQVAAGFQSLWCLQGPGQETGLGLWTSPMSQLLCKVRNEMSGLVCDFTAAADADDMSRTKS